MDGLGPLATTFYTLMNEDLSLEQLEHSTWTDTDLLTGLIKNCHEYRKLPIRDLSVGQIRTLISQDIGVHFLLPKAMNLLTQNALTEGDFYPGDLLSAVLSLDHQVWTNCQDLRDKLKRSIQNQKDLIETEVKNRELLRRIDSFLSS
jgi:hypothetical protein